MSGLFAILMAVGCTSSPAEPAPTHAADGPTTGVPGKVADLIVTDSSGTSVVLAFTEVDDGYGLPADYAIRAHVGPMDWGSAEEVTHGTCAAPLQGRSVGASISCTVENLQPDTPYTFQVAAFRGTFQAGAVYGELSNVVPDMGDGPEPTTGSGSYPNEPAGWSTIASVNFTNGINAQTGVCNEHGSETKRANSEYITDSSAPTGDGAVFRGRFPNGWVDGGAPWRFDCWGPSIDTNGSNEYSEIYVSFWMKIEGSDYQNQTNGTKVFYVAYGDGSFHNDGYLQLQGTGTQAVQSEITLRAKLSEMDEDGADTPALSIDPNLSTRKLRVGEWAQVEARMKINDIGSSNGKLDMWVNGTHTTSISDWRFRSAENPRSFYHLQFTPVYGGNSGDVRSRDDYWRLDNLYVSGKT